MSYMLIHTSLYSKPSDLLPKTEGSDLDKPGKDEVKKSTEEQKIHVMRLINSSVLRYVGCSVL